MYLADGAVRLRISEVRADEGEIDAMVEIGGAVASRQGLNIPGETAALPAVPEEDLEHVRTGERIGVDIVAAELRAPGRRGHRSCASTRGCRWWRRSRSRRRSRARRRSCAPRTA